MKTNDFINSVLCGDAPKVLGGLCSDSIDLTVTSPPYDELRSYGGFQLDVGRLIKELYRVTRPGRVVVWVTGDATVRGSETGGSFRQALMFMQAGFNLHDTMIFQKQNPVPQIYRKRYQNVFEYMFVFSKGLVQKHNALKIPCEHAGLVLNGTTYKNYSRHAQKRGKLAKPVSQTKIRGNVWTYVVGKRAEDQQAKAHPAPFPCQLVRDHILSWSDEGDTVLDPMCGSGTTCVVAKQLDRRFIGVDCSTEYCDLAVKRIDAAQRIQPSLFDGAVAGR